MEQLVTLTFQEGTFPLSYADYLILVTTGRDNKLLMAQNSMDLISDKCEELGPKISAEKSQTMKTRTTTPNCQLRGQGGGLA